MTKLDRWSAVSRGTDLVLNGVNFRKIYEIIDREFGNDDKVTYKTIEKFHSILLDERRKAVDLFNSFDETELTSTSDYLREQIECLYETLENTKTELYNVEKFNNDLIFDNKIFQDRIKELEAELDKYKKYTDHYITIHFADESNLEPINPNHPYADKLDTHPVVRVGLAVSNDDIYIVEDNMNAQ